MLLLRTRMSFNESANSYKTPRGRWETTTSQVASNVTHERLNLPSR